MRGTWKSIYMPAHGDAANRVLALRWVGNRTHCRTGARIDGAGRTLQRRSDPLRHVPTGQMYACYIFTAQLVIRVRRITGFHVMCHLFPIIGRVLIDPYDLHNIRTERNNGT